MVSKTHMSKGELFNDTPRGVLEMLLVGGGIVAGLSFAPALLLALAGGAYAIRSSDKRRLAKIQGSFSYLRRKKYITVRTLASGKKEYALTASGYSHAETVRVRQRLEKKKRPSKWDGQWRLIMFDVAAEERTKRNAFRSLIRRLGAVMLQKSVWIYPFDCTEEVDLLRGLFNFSRSGLRLVVAGSIGDDAFFRRTFKV